MLSNEYFESVIFSSGKNFNVSRHVDLSYLDRLHWHPFVEILISLGTHNEVSVNFTKYTLGLNDIVVVYPGDLHAIDACEEGSLLVIQFSNDLLTTVNALNSALPLLSQHPYLKYDPASPDCDRMVLLMKEFCEAYDAPGGFKEVRMYALLLQFFAQLGSRCLQQRSEDVPETISARNKSVKKMAEACLYISRNCTQPITLEDAAAFMGVSKSHFAHLFKEYTNTTFVDYLTEERIKRAQTLFLTPETQIIDVAFDSGFSSISSFNRAFKKITGQSPSKFREALLEQME